MNKLLLIDADSLCFQSSKDTLQESIQVMDDKIQNMYDKTGASHSCFFISKGKYFRHSIFPQYKLSRGKYETSLKYLKTLKAYLREEYNANYMTLSESDDLVAYWNNIDWILLNGDPMPMPIDHLDKATNVEPIDTIVCSPDKDLLQSIESFGSGHFNYTYKLEDKTNPDSIIKGWWVETSESQARGFKLGQMIFGDAGDSVVGLAGKGEKYWEKMCLAGKVTINHILDEYIAQHGTSQGIYEFQKNYRLLHLLDCDEDFIQEIGIIPSMPKINVINKIIEYE